MNDIDKMVATLHRHGFSEAAQKLKYANGIDAALVLLAWADYPRCMEQHPVQLSSFRGRSQDRGG